jgi:hypothetical protein
MREQIGFLPNFYVAQTSRPDLIEAEVALMGTILLKDGGLSPQAKGVHLPGHFGSESQHVLRDRALRNGSHA